MAEMELVALRSERICQLEAKLMPEMTFSADGQLESGFYPATFKQTLGLIENDRRHDVFVKLVYISLVATKNGQCLTCLPMINKVPNKTKPKTYIGLALKTSN